MEAPVGLVKGVEGVAIWALPEMHLRVPVLC